MDTFASAKLVIYIGINNQNLDPKYARTYIFTAKVPDDVNDCFWVAQSYSAFDRTSLFSWTAWKLSILLMHSTPERA